MTAIAICLAATPARAQKLGIQGTQFTIDGTPKFLTFITYFGAMGAPNVTADLHEIRGLGFDGIRIWPNLDTGPQLMNGDGSLRTAELQHLLSILNLAKQERLVVDVTFTYEHIPGMTPSTALVGIANATNVLRSYENLIFDIQNERNVRDRRYMSEDDVGRIFRALKAVDPSRIATASNAPDGASIDADFTSRLGLDVNAYHDDRFPNWYQLDELQSVVNALRANGKPAYLQEPNTTFDTVFHYPANDRAEYFLQAIANAKMAGAAAWCFHTEEGVDFGNGGPPFFEDRLRSHPNVEWPFVNSLKARVVLRTADGHYLVAESGGGSGMRADRSASGPGSWEVFAVTALAGGPLISGDRISAATADGNHYMLAVNGGGGPLRATSASVGASETFVIEKVGGGVIHHGDSVTLRVGDTSWYVSAEGGGGGAVNVNSGTRGSFETFTILFVTPHSTDASTAKSVREVKVK
ncbi:MAG TPA: hypothetical protein VGY57_16910 [Vicinamibacterales bacterium]|nr:hypothetical protein [Vicinamibacterales bacterium]